jgi:RNA:NAD 2'-phosphotransferase (TPT1/KptA family)
MLCADPVLQVKYWRAMEGHASRDLMAERLMTRKLSEEIESIVTGAHSDTSTISSMRNTLKQMQQQVAHLHKAIDEQRLDALRKEQQLISDYKRALKLNSSGNPR